MVTELNKRNKSIKLGSPPKATNLQVSKSMKGNKAKNTQPELLLKKVLRANNVKGYHLHYNKLPGTPDICFPAVKLAIFVNGCFWHRCPYCRLKTPKSHRGFWNVKFIRNKQRDLTKRRQLKCLGWKSMIVWECQIKKSLNKTIKRITTALKDKHTAL
jgi:DNA mismatch endonuclease (patch repair protein)